MAQDRNEVVEALKQGALNSQAEYITVRREDLLVALGTGPSKPQPQETKDKKQA